MNGFASYPSLHGRVAFVTGGGSGIGASIVEHLCAQQARVAFVDIDRAASERLVETIKGRGQPAPPFLPCDLRDIAALRSAVTEIGAQLGPIRILVNNAANDERHALESVTPEFWDDRFAVNLRHQFFAAQAVAPGHGRGRRRARSSTSAPCRGWSARAACRPIPRPRPRSPV